MSLEDLLVGTFQDHEHVQTILEIIEGIVFFLDGLKIGNGCGRRRSIPWDTVI